MTNRPEPRLKEISPFDDLNITEVSTPDTFSVTFTITNHADLVASAAAFRHLSSALLANASYYDAVVWDLLDPTNGPLDYDEDEDDEGDEEGGLHA